MKLYFRVPNTRFNHWDTLANTLFDQVIAIKFFLASFTVETEYK